MHILVRVHHIDPPIFGANKEHIWQQSNNPVTDTTPHGGVQDYLSISTFTDTEHWGGLEKGGDNALLDGSVDHRDWWYAVGSSVAHNDGIRAEVVAQRRFGDDGDFSVHTRRAVRM